MELQLAVLPHGLIFLMALHTIHDRKCCKRKNRYIIWLIH